VPGDEELLARVQKKDYEAVGVLFDRYTRLFVGIAYRILRDRGEAEDMVQEIFLRLCQKSNTFDPAKGSARTWMVQFVYRRSFDRRSYLTRRFFYGGTEIERLKNTLQEATGPPRRFKTSLYSSGISSVRSHTKLFFSAHL
jgi:RNA polymerase sigma-70 factor (ECF subfamily)